MGVDVVKFPEHRVNRRSVIAAGGVGLAGAVHRSVAGARAEGLSGTITVGYESGNDLLEQFLQETKAAIESANPDAKIELAPSPSGSFLAQVFLQLNGGNAPDVFIISGLAIGELSAAGFLAPLDDHLAGWDGWEQFPETIRETLTWDGHVWAIPYLVDTTFLYYRRDLFAEAGLDPEWQPSHPDEIITAAAAIRDLDDSLIPYALYAGANAGNATVSRGFLPLVAAYGGELYDDEGRFVIDSCPIRDALDFYALAYGEAGVVPADVMTDPAPTSTMRDAMAAGELGILYEGCWAWGPWLEGDEDDTTSNIGFALFPRVDGEPFAIGGLGNSFYLNAKSEAPDLGWAFIAAFNSAETQAAICLQDPHIPPRADAAANPAFGESPFLSAMIGSAGSLLLAAPDPDFRDLIGVVQTTTGEVASGAATTDEAVSRYQSELTRILGPDRVTTEPCP